MHRIILAAVLVISVVQITTAFSCYRDIPYYSCPDLCEYNIGPNICQSGPCYSCFRNSYNQPSNPCSNKCDCQSISAYSCFRNTNCDQCSSNMCDCQSNSAYSCFRNTNCDQCSSNMCDCQSNSAYSCFRNTNCDQCSSNMCDCQSKTAYSCFRDIGDQSNTCNCECSMGPCYSCFTDMATSCNNCGQSPLCSCLKAANGGSSCGQKIYYPEVDYPLSIVDVKPYYCGVCFSC